MFYVSNESEEESVPNNESTQATWPIDQPPTHLISLKNEWSVYQLRYDKDEDENNNNNNNIMNKMNNNVMNS